MKYKLFILISIVVLLIIIILSWPDKNTKIIFCDVGQGDGMLLIQKKFQMIIDSGPDNKKMLKCLSKYIPFWDKQIELAIISHNDGDHSGGLKSIRNYYQIEEQNIYAGNLRENDVLRYGNISFEVLSAGSGQDENEASVVGILSIGERKILLMGDVNSDVEQRLVWRKMLQGKANIVKISHHGSAEATSQELLDTVRPEEVIISVGKNNKFGHPTKIVLERLDKMGVKIRRTDLEGDIIYEW